MGELRARAYEGAVRVKRRFDRARLTSGRGDVEVQVAKLRRRVNELEHEVMENRQLARRIAELTDVVEQLLLPEDVRDPHRLEERLRQVRTRRRRPPRAGV